MAGADDAVTAAAEAEAPADESAMPDPGARHGAVVAEAVDDVARLSVKEAALRLDLSDDAVLVFRNSASDSLNVIYRRRDGNLGWIDPR